MRKWWRDKTKLRRAIERLERTNTYGQHGLAFDLGVTGRTLRKWKTGERKPDLAHGLAINRCMEGERNEKGQSIYPGIMQREAGYDSMIMAYKRDYINTTGKAPKKTDEQIGRYLRRKEIGIFKKQQVIAKVSGEEFKKPKPVVYEDSILDAYEHYEMVERALGIT